MSQFTYLRRVGAAVALIALLAACGQPAVSPTTSAEKSVAASASAEPTPASTEGEVITPSIDAEPSESAAPTDEGTGEIDVDSPFNDAESMIAAVSAGFEMFGLPAATEQIVEGETVYVSESADGDALVVVPSADGATIDALRIVDVNAAAEAEASPVLMWSLLLNAVLPDETEINQFVNEQVFAAIESGEAVDASETFGGLEVSVTGFDGADEVTVTIERAD